MLFKINDIVAAIDSGYVSDDIYELVATICYSQYQCCSFLNAQIRRRL